MRNSLIVLIVGLLIAVGSWAPLLIVEAQDPQAMPVGLGLFTFAVSLVGCVVALIGFIKLMPPWPELYESASKRGMSSSADPLQVAPQHAGSDKSWRMMPSW